MQTLLSWFDLSHGFYTYYLLFVFFMFEYIPSTKNKKQQSRGTIWNTGCKHWTAEKFKGQEDYYEWDWFLLEFNRYSSD